VSLTPQLHAEKSFQRVHNIACWHRSAVSLGVTLPVDFDG
jgi:hypothetical protein